MIASSKCMQLLENCRCLLHQSVRWNRKYRKFNTVKVLNKHGIESRLTVSVIPCQRTRRIRHFFIKSVWDARIFAVSNTSLYRF
ncbi:Pentatricopeptide repeat-containing protein [Trichinella pseudospiralis]